MKIYIQTRTNKHAHLENIVAVTTQYFTNESGLQLNNTNKDKGKCK